MRFACTNVVALSLLTTNMAPAFQVTSPHMAPAFQVTSPHMAPAFQVTMMRSRQHVHARVNSLLRGVEDPMDVEVTGKQKKDIIAPNRTKTQTLNQEPESLKPTQNFGPVPFHAPKIGRTEFSYKAAKVKIVEKSEEPPPRKIASNTPQAPDFTPTRKESPPIRKAPTATDIAATAAAQAPPTSTIAANTDIASASTLPSLPKSKKPALDSGPVAFGPPKVPPPASQRKVETAVDSGSGMDGDVATQPPPADAKAAKKYKAANLPGGGAIPFEPMTDAPMGPQKYSNSNDYWEEEPYMDQEPPRSIVWSAQDLQEEPKVTRGRGQRTPPPNDYYEEGRGRGRRPLPSNEYYQEGPEVMNNRRRGRRNLPDEYEQRTEVVTNDGPGRRNPPNDYEQGPQVTNDRRRSPPPSRDVWTPKEETNEPEVPAPNKRANRSPPAPPVPFKMQAPVPMGETKKKEVAPPPKARKQVLWEAAKVRVVPQVDTATSSAAKVDTAAPPIGNVLKVDITLPAANVASIAKASAAAKSLPNTKASPPMSPFTATEDMGKRKKEAPTEVMTTSAPQSVVAPPLPIPKDEVSDIDPPAAVTTPKEKVVAAPKEEVPDIAPPAPVAATAAASKAPIKPVSAAPKVVVDIEAPAAKVADVATPAPKVVEVAQILNVTPPAPKVVAVTPPAPKVVDVTPPAPKLVDGTPPAPKVVDVTPPAPKVMEVAQIVDVTPPAPKDVNVAQIVDVTPPAPKDVNVAQIADVTPPTLKVVDVITTSPKAMDVTPPVPVTVTAESKSVSTSAKSLTKGVDADIFGFNKALVDTIYEIICFLYPVKGNERDFARFYVLETVARVPYFAYLSSMHLRETFGERYDSMSERMRTHYAEADNELHHLLIMESLGGNSNVVDRTLAQLMAFGYYWYVIVVYSINEPAAYHLSELIEDHAFNTYNTFLNNYEKRLKGMPVPDIARKYYEQDNPFLFDLFCTVKNKDETGNYSTRRPELKSLYDVFVNIRDDEKEHWKTLCNLVQFDDMNAVDAMAVESTKPSQEPK